jgi:hypothetical protein
MLLGIQVHNEAKATKFTYSEEVPIEKGKHVKNIILENQAGDRDAYGLASIPEQTDYQKKIPFKVEKWCGDDWWKLGDACPALKKEPTYAWVLDFTFELENGRKIVAYNRIVVKNAGENVNIIRTGYDTFKVE